MRFSSPLPRHAMRVQPWLLATFITAATLAFLSLLKIASHDAIWDFDRALLLSFRNPQDLADPIGGLGIEEAMRDITGLGGTMLSTLFSILAGVYFFLNEQHRRGLFLLMAIACGATLNYGLKHLIDRPRPDLVPHIMEVTSPSFPSGHTTAAAVVYLTIAGLIANSLSNRRLRGYVFFCAATIVVSVGISRVYLGVHWPSDVLAAWLLGGSWALLSVYVQNRLMKH